MRFVDGVPSFLCGETDQNGIIVYTALHRLSKGTAQEHAELEIVYNNTFSSAWELKRIKNRVGVVKREREKPPVQSFCQLGAAQDTETWFT